MGDQGAILVIGAGGHGLVVADILRAVGLHGGKLRVAGFLDDDPSLAAQTRLGFPVLGTIEDITRTEHDGIVVAIGDNAVREVIFERLVQSGENVVRPIHPSAMVAPGAVIGAGSVVCAGAIVNPGARIGRNVIVNTGCIVEHDCLVEDHSHIAPGTCLGGEVVIGKGVMVGIGAVVLPGVRVGRHSLVGAGAVVTRDVAEGSVVAGVPARVRRTI